MGTCNIVWEESIIFVLAFFFLNFITSTLNASPKFIIMTLGITAKMVMTMSSLRQHNAIIRDS